MKQAAAKLGAIFYLLWAVIHVVAGASLAWSALHDINGHLAGLATGASPDALPRLPEGSVVSAVAAFHAFNMVWLGALVGVIAVRRNWRNDALGFWLNLIIVGALDLGLAMFLLAPGIMRVTDGLPGPTLFALAAVFSALGRRHARVRGAPATDVLPSTSAVTP